MNLSAKLFYYLRLSQNPALESMDSFVPMSDKWNIGKALTFKVTKGTIRQAGMCDIIQLCIYCTKPL